MPFAENHKSKPNAGFLLQLKSTVGHLYLFFRSKVSRPAHFMELRTGDARPLRLTARDSAGTASPLAVPLAFALGHRVPHSVTP
jgi:hypothetical protein